MAKVSILKEGIKELTSIQEKLQERDAKVNLVESFNDLNHLNKVVFAKFFRFLLERGVYISPSPFEACFVSMAHTQNNLEITRDLILEFIKQC